MKKIYLLHGDNAVNFYQNYGVDACIKQGFNNTTMIEFNEKTPVEAIVQTVLNCVSGSLDSCIITEKDFNKIEKAFK